MPKDLHLVAIVGNDIIYDSRVKKAAASATAAGYRTTVICYSPTNTRTESYSGDIKVIKVPVPFNARDKSKRLRVALRPFQEKELIARFQGKFVHKEAMIRRRKATLKISPQKSINWYANYVSCFVIQAQLKFDQRFLASRKWLNRAFDILIKIYNRIRRRITQRLSQIVGRSVFLDYEVAFGPILEELQPDIIHAHDYHMIGVGVTAAQSLQGMGKDTKIIYDAHELVEGLSYPKFLIKRWMREEKKFINQVDDVICISDPQANRIQELHNLESSPQVVLNCPLFDKNITLATTIRDEINTQERILVYHGQVDPGRDLETLVRSLEFFPPDVHIAIMTNNSGKYLKELEAIADSLSTLEQPIKERLHILPYVPAADLPEYLSTADAAVVPQIQTKNHKIAMPNKLFESIQAKLPILASDVGAVATYVLSKGIGTIFESGSPKSLAKAGSLLLKEIDGYKQHFSEKLLTQTTWEYQSKVLIDVYLNVLGTSPLIHQKNQREMVDIFDVLGVSDSHVKGLAIGPRNMAGQAYLMADAVQRFLNIPSISFSLGKSGYDFPIHLPVSMDDWRDPFWQRKHREMLSAGFSHVLAECGTGVLGTMGGKFIDEQVSLLDESGISVAVLLHGSEIRDPIAHQQYAYSPFQDNDDLTKTLEKAVSILRQHLGNSDIPIFVTTPDLLQYIEGEWLPAVVDVNFWSSIPSRPNKSIPTVLHMPSSNQLKGSKYIDFELLRLENAGKIKYIRPETQTPAALVPSLIAQSDIIIDGIVIGAYGVMSCQAMAAGRLIITNTNELGEIREECPILHADPAILNLVLEDLLENRTQWDSIILRGQEFVRKYHDGSFTAQKIQDFLNT